VVSLAVTAHRTQRTPKVTVDTTEEFCHEILKRCTIIKAACCRVYLAITKDGGLI